MSRRNLINAQVACWAYSIGGEKGAYIGSGTEGLTDVQAQSSFTKKGKGNERPVRTLPRSGRSGWKSWVTRVSAWSKTLQPLQSCPFHAHRALLGSSSEPGSSSEVSGE